MAEEPRPNPLAGGCQCAACALCAFRTMPRMAVSSRWPPPRRLGNTGAPRAVGPRSATTSAHTAARQVPESAVVVVDDALSVIGLWRDDLKDSDSPDTRLAEL